GIHSRSVAVYSEPARSASRREAESARLWASASRTRGANGSFAAAAVGAALATAGARGARRNQRCLIMGTSPNNVRFRGTMKTDGSWLAEHAFEVRLHRELGRLREVSPLHPVVVRLGHPQRHQPVDLCPHDLRDLVGVVVLGTHPARIDGGLDGIAQEDV